MKTIQNILQKKLIIFISLFFIINIRLLSNETFNKTKTYKIETNNLETILIEDNITHQINNKIELENVLNENNSIDTSKLIFLGDIKQEELNKINYFFFEGIDFCLKSNIKGKCIKSFKNKGFKYYFSKNIKDIVIIEDPYYKYKKESKNKDSTIKIYKLFTKQIIFPTYNICIPKENIGCIYKKENKNLFSLVPIYK
jgi:hypothetical protein